MKRILPKIACITPFLSFLSVLAFSQDLTGIWRGYFQSESGGQYKFELQLEQKQNFITGVSYSYQDTRFYGKATLTGSYSRASSTALVQEIKTVELRMSLGSVACIMKCKFDYVRSGREEFLEGTFSSMYEHTDTLRGILRGGNCGGGTVVLRKVPTSDFYVEPFLRNKVASNPPPKEQVKPEKKEPPVVKSTPVTPKNNPTVKTNPPKTNPSNNLPKRDESISKQPEPTIEEAKPKEELKADPVIVPSILKTRENALVRTIYTDAKEISISIYDNGEIDDDTVSVYLDNRLVLARKRLTASPLSIKIKINEDNPQHDLVMVAENLGRIPPNTSLMIVNAGDKRYEVRITSNEQKNALVRFYYKDPDAK